MHGFFLVLSKCAFFYVFFFRMLELLLPTLFSNGYIISQIKYYSNEKCFHFASLSWILSSSYKRYVSYPNVRLFNCTIIQCFPKHLFYTKNIEFSYSSSYFAQRFSLWIILYIKLNISRQNSYNNTHWLWAYTMLQRNLNVYMTILNKFNSCPE